jgi:hypothetical protein
VIPPRSLSNPCDIRPNHALRRKRVIRKPLGPCAVFASDRNDDDADVVFLANSRNPFTIDPNLSRRGSSEQPYTRSISIVDDRTRQKVYKAHLHSNSIPVLLKHRFSKKYRHPSLDANITRSRVAGEARTLIKCLRYFFTLPTRCL